MQNVYFTFVGIRKPWTTEELAVLHRAFSTSVKPATNEECRNVQAICSSLKQRGIPQIKSRAWALAKKATEKK